MMVWWPKLATIKANKTLLCCTETSKFIVVFELNRLVLACLIVTLEDLQVVFVRSVYNSALFLASCCCSFLLHVVANLICILLVSRQLVLFSDLPKFLHSFAVTKGVLRCCSEKFHLHWRQFFLLYFFWGSKFLFQIEEEWDSVHYILLLLKISGPTFGSKVLLVIPSTWENFARIC